MWPQCCSRPDFQGVRCPFIPGLNALSNLDPRILFYGYYECAITSDCYFTLEYKLYISEILNKWSTFLNKYTFLMGN